MQGRHVRAEHVWAAIEAATEGPVVEGCVGAGTGTSCFGWKALFPAVVESVEEAILNSLCRAETIVGRDGNRRHALPIEEVAALVGKESP